jgi:beta-glucanase (GH16 family)
VSGEIDIMEARGRKPDVYGGTIHYGGNWPNNQWASTGDQPYPAGTGDAANFHVYAVEWTADKIAWFCDNYKIGEKTNWYADANHPKPAPFDVDFHILLNLAVGGNFDDNREPPASFTSGEMKVDYVRVYKWSDTLTEPEIPDDAGPVDPDTDIKEVKNRFFSLSQTRHALIINPLHKLQSVELYAANGQLISKEAGNTILTSRLNKGAYILILKDMNGNQATFKTVIQ